MRSQDGRSSWPSARFSQRWKWWQPLPVARTAEESPVCPRLQPVVDRAHTAKVVEGGRAEPGEVDSPVVDLEALGRRTPRHDAVGVALVRRQADAARDRRGGFGGARRIPDRPPRSRRFRRRQPPRDEEPWRRHARSPVRRLLHRLDLGARSPALRARRRRMRSCRSVPDDPRKRSRARLSSAAMKRAPSDAGSSASTRTPPSTAQVRQYLRAWIRRSSSTCPASPRARCLTRSACRLSCFIPSFCAASRRDWAARGETATADATTSAWSSERSPIENAFARIGTASSCPAASIEALARPTEEPASDDNSEAASKCPLDRALRRYR